MPAEGQDPGFAFTLLPRHGRRPLGFEGRLLVSAEAREPGLPVVLAVALHERAGGGYVAAIRHGLRGGGPAGARCYAEPAEAAEGVLAFLHAHDPLRDLPADALLPPPDGGDEAARVAAAAALAPRLRAAWHGLLEATFGPPAHHDHRGEQG